MSDAHPHLPRLHLNHGHLIEGKGKDVPVLFQVLFVSKCLTKELHMGPESCVTCMRLAPPQHAAHPLCLVHLLQVHKNGPFH